MRKTRIVAVLAVMLCVLAVGVCGRIILAAGSKESSKKASENADRIKTLQEKYKLPSEYYLAVYERFMREASDEMKAQLGTEHPNVIAPIRKMADLLGELPESSRKLTMEDLDTMFKEASSAKDSAAANELSWKLLEITGGPDVYGVESNMPICAFYMDDGKCFELSGTFAHITETNEKNEKVIVKEYSLQ